MTTTPSGRTIYEYARLRHGHLVRGAGGLVHVYPEGTIVPIVTEGEHVYAEIDEGLMPLTRDDYENVTRYSFVVVE